MLPEFTLKVSINNQISIGLQNVFRKPKDVYRRDHKGFSMVEIKKHEYADRCKDSVREEGESFEQKLDRLYPPLDIKKKSQRGKKSRNLRKGFGNNSACRSIHTKRVPPFGVKQGQKLRECGAAIDLMQERHGGAARIVTLTLVGDTHEAFECLAANSWYMVNRITQFIRRNYGKDAYWFFVWEHQKRGALHLHICVWHAIANKAARCGVLLVGAWYAALRDLEAATGIDMFVRRDGKTYTPKRKWQSRNEPMRKSAGGYFSKYAAKASKKEERKHIEKLAQKYPPSRFWGSSQSVKDLIKENTFVYQFESHKSEESAKIYEEVREVLSQFNILSYGSYEWKYQKEFQSFTSKQIEVRTITEGFKQNYYYSRQDFLEVKESIWDCIGASEY